MSTSQPPFVAEQYSARANDDLPNEVHRQGADLDQMGTLLREQRYERLLGLGCGGGHLSYRAALPVGHVVTGDVTASMLATVEAAAVAQGPTNFTMPQAPTERPQFADANAVSWLRVSPCTTGRTATEWPRAMLASGKRGAP